MFVVLCGLNTERKQTCIVQYLDGKGCNRIMYGYVFRNKENYSSMIDDRHLLSYKTCLDTKPVLYQDRFGSLIDIVVSM